VRQVPISDEVIAALEEIRQTFRDLYGRDPGDEGQVFSLAMNPVESHLVPIRILREAGISEERIYAYYITDGLIPTEANLDLISDTDLAAYRAYCEEFHTLIEDPDNEGNISSLAFAVTGAEFLAYCLGEASVKLRMVLTDFLNRHHKHGGYVDFELRTPLDYCLFSAVKTLKVLTSVEHLTRRGMAESIYPLSRGLLENYLYLKAIAGSDDFFSRWILPKVDGANYAFDTKNGRINYNRVVDRKSGKPQPVWITTKKLINRESTTQTDRELFDIFYATASQFVHVDVLSARTYFYEADPYDEIDPALIAQLISVVLIGEIVRALGPVPGVSKQFAIDTSHFLEGLGKSLLPALQLVDSDREHSNPIYQILIKVVDAWVPSNDRPKVH
jgi:hypothetical protein